MRVDQNQQVAIPHAFVNRLRLKILLSPQRINYGNIFTRVNGESANMIMTTSSNGQEVLCTLDLSYRAGFRLRQGRNSIEIKAVDFYGRSFFGSFLIYVGQNARSGNPIRTETQLADRSATPPQLHLLSPREPLSDRDSEAVFAGFIEHPDNHLVLTISGHEVPIQPVASPEDKRTISRIVKARFRFRQNVKLSRGTTEVRVSVRDRGGNTTDVIVPVYPLLPFPGGPGARTKYAVVIGISRYKNPELNLRFAHRDALAFKEVLLSRNGGFHPTNVITLVNEDATIHNMRTALFTFLTRAKESDQVVIYFAGHGARDPNNPMDLYFLPYDTDPDNMGATALPMWQLRDLFQRTIKSRQVITFADACHSAGIGDGVDTPHNLINQYMYQAASNNGRAVITASDIGEFAEESDRWRGGGGVFTHYLLKGLAGEADVDQDKTITTGELFEFVRHHVSEATAGRQTPVALTGAARQLPFFSVTAEN